MKKFKTWMIALASIGIGMAIMVAALSPSSALLSDSQFSYKIDDSYARPILRWWTPKDMNGDRPRDILIEFFYLAHDGKYKDASNLCYFGWRDGDGTAQAADWNTIEGDQFNRICREIDDKGVSLIISGSTIRQKAGYYSIQCKLIDCKNRESELNFYFIRVGDVWKFRETSVSRIPLALARSQ